MKGTSGNSLNYVSAEEAVQAIQSNSRIYLGGGTGIPLELEKALVARARELENVEVNHVATFAGGDYLSPQYARQAVNEGRADYVPIFLSQIPALYRDGTLPLDAALIQVSPPDAHGFCSLGVEVGVTMTAAEEAKLVIAEVNPNMPRVLGDSFIHVSHIHLAVKVNYPLPEALAPSITPEQKKIGEYIGEMVEDDEDTEVQKQAVFALSQLPDGVPMLIEIARTHPRAKVRKDAIFWLGQSDDPRALEALIDLARG